MSVANRLVLDVGHDVREGLTATPKRLPPRLLYDARGSELFERITELPEYYLTRTEAALLQARAEQILSMAGEALTVVELGAGSARKTAILLRALIARQGPTVFIPVDVSRTALEESRARLRASLPGLTVEPLEGRYRVALSALKGRRGRKLVLFIGSSVGNFEPPEALELLRDIRAGLSEGDSLLLGTDLVKDAAVLVPAYDDAQGVTAAFNKNVLVRINRELGANFAPDAFRHVALWNAAASRIEMHLEATHAHAVFIKALDLEVRFEEGERIHTENSHKFTLEGVNALLEKAGFERRHPMTDDRGQFALHLAFRQRAEGERDDA